MLQNVGVHFSYPLNETQRGCTNYRNGPKQKWDDEPIPFPHGAGPARNSSCLYAQIRFESLAGSIFVQNESEGLFLRLILSKQVFRQIYNKKTFLREWLFQNKIDRFDVRLVSQNLSTSTELQVKGSWLHIPRLNQFDLFTQSLLIADL